MKIKIEKKRKGFEFPIQGLNFGQIFTEINAAVN